MDTASLCEHLNVQNRAAKNVQEKCSLLFLAMYFRENPGQVETAVVDDVRANGLVVILPKYNYEVCILLYCLRVSAWLCCVSSECVSLVVLRCVSVRVSAWLCCVVLFVCVCPFSTVNLQRLLLHFQQGAVVFEKDGKWNFPLEALFPAGGKSGSAVGEFPVGLSYSLDADENSAAFAVGADTVCTFRRYDRSASRVCCVDFYQV